MRRHPLLAVLAICCLAMLSALTAAERPAVGVGMWPFAGADQAIRQLGPAWCYDWGPAPCAKLPATVEFVPMIWDEKGVNPKDLATAQQNGRILLGFNEPDHKDQADMTVDQALELWPQLAATGMRLGSPAPAGGATADNGWLTRFMQGARARNLRVDFLCLHFYSPRFTDPKAASDDLRKFLVAVHDRHRLPIWLTEFALADWKLPATAEQQIAFMQKALPMLDALPFVERYAWFALPPNPSGDGGALKNADLSTNDGTLTAAGLAYRTLLQRR